MTCHDVQQELKAELDGELGGWRAFRVRRHVAGCDACRAEREALSRLSNALRLAETAELPDALRARLIALAPEPEVARKPRRSLAFAGGGLATACLAVAAFVFLRPAPVPDVGGATSIESMAKSATRSDATVVAEATENRSAPTIANPVQTFSAPAARDGMSLDASKVSVDREPDKKSRARGALPASPRAEIAEIVVAIEMTDADLIAVVKAEGGTVVTRNPLLLEITSEKLTALKKSLSRSARRTNNQVRTQRFVKVRLRTTVLVRP